MESGELTDIVQKSKAKTLTHIIGMATGYTCMIIETFLLIGEYLPGCIAGYVYGAPIYLHSVRSLKKK